jgi:hypothetical protein
MSGRKPSGPTLSAKGAEEKAARRDRQAEALRENLLKRKAQTRGRRAEDRPEPPPAGVPGRSRAGS